MPFRKNTGSRGVHHAMSASARKARNQRKYAESAERQGKAPVHATKKQQGSRFWHI